MNYAIEVLESKLEDKKGWLNVTSNKTLIHHCKNDIEDLELAIHNLKQLEPNQ